MNLTDIVNQSEQHPLYIHFQFGAEREAEVLLSQGQTVKQVCRALEVSEQTYYRWRREYWGLNTTQAKKLKELEKENTRLKKLVADISLDNAILKELLSKK